MDALDLDTPALYVDLDVLERNIHRMQEQCRGWGVELRPHVKTHKIPEIAQMQLDAGAIGITVAKVGEAEVLPGDEVPVAYPLVKAKLPRLRELVKTRRVKVAVDSVEGIARWRLLDQRVRDVVRETDAALALLVERDLVEEIHLAGAPTLFRLNAVKSDTARQLLEEHE